MKKTEMKANNMKTAILQRLFRGWHQRCVFRGSDLYVGFTNPKGKRLKELMAKCSDCLIDRHEDIGLSPPRKDEFRADNPINKINDKEVG